MSFDINSAYLSSASYPIQDVEKSFCNKIQVGTLYGISSSAAKHNTLLQSSFKE